MVVPGGAWRCFEVEVAHRKAAHDSRDVHHGGVCVTGMCATVMRVIGAKRVRL